LRDPVPKKPEHTHCVVGLTLDASQRFGFTQSMCVPRHSTCVSQGSCSQPNYTRIRAQKVDREGPSSDPPSTFFYPPPYIIATEIGTKSRTSTMRHERVKGALIGPMGSIDWTAETRSMMGDEARMRPRMVRGWSLGPGRPPRPEEKHWIGRVRLGALDGRGGGALIGWEGEH
jgi:hypothetical protein